MTVTDHNEPTKAAEPITSATAPAPSEDETQSVYAWSQDSDDDTQLIQRRSWKIPVTLAVLASAAAVAVGVVEAWPRHSTPEHPAVAAASPAIMQRPDPDSALSPADKEFVNSLKSAGFHPGANDMDKTIGLGHVICDTLAQGFSQSDAATSLHRHTPQLTLEQDKAITESAAAAYCPWYR